MDVLNKIQTQLKAPKGQYNSFGKYAYRSCEDILEALKPLLAEYGATLTLSDEIIHVGERYYIKTTATLCWEGNERFAVGHAREPESKKGMDESQITGAASSYARKYALNGLFCIDDNKDADYTNTHGHNTPNNQARQRSNGASVLPQEQFEQYLPGWKGQIKEGKRTVQDIVSAARGKGINLTSAQIKQLEAA
jgi:hypothetical protein